PPPCVQPKTLNRTFMKQFGTTIMVCFVLLAVVLSSGCRSTPAKPSDSKPGPRTAGQSNDVPIKLRITTEAPDRVDVTLGVKVEGSHPAVETKVPIDVQVNAKSPPAVSVPVSLEVSKQPAAPVA